MKSTTSPSEQSFQALLELNATTWCQSTPEPTPVDVSELSSPGSIARFIEISNQVGLALLEIPSALGSFRKQTVRDEVGQTLLEGDRLSKTGRVEDAIVTLKHGRDLAIDTLGNSDSLSVEVQKVLASAAVRVHDLDLAVKSYTAAVRGMEQTHRFESYEIAESYASLGTTLALSNETTLATTHFAYAERLIEDSLLIPIAPELTCDAAMHVFNSVAAFHLSTDSLDKARDAFKNAVSAIFRTLGTTSEGATRFALEVETMTELMTTAGVPSIELTTNDYSLCLNTAATARQWVLQTRHNLEQ